MKIENMLAPYRKAIIDQWFDLVVRTYPADASGFFKGQKDPFANPVGRNTLRGLENLIDSLLADTFHESTDKFLDDIIRMRAVQGFSPEQAVGFICELKGLVRKTISGQLGDPEVLKALLDFEHKIDALMLRAFGIYVDCREKVYELKASEMRKRTFRAFERAKLVVDDPDDRSETDKP